MKIAFLILAHTDPNQLERLMRAINLNCRIFIHLDKKVDIHNFSGIELPSNAEFIKERTKVDWAGFNMIKATLSLMQSALDSGEKFTHLALMSGLDYPIKPISALQDLLFQNTNRQFIRFIDIEDSPEYYLPRAQKYYYFDRFLPRYDTQLRKLISATMNLFLRKSLLKGIKHAYGSQMWAITPPCAAYILDFVKDNNEFIHWHKSSMAPDETFFHTIIANSPFLNQTDGFEKFTGRGCYKLTNLHLTHHTAAKTYNELDFDDIQKSGKYFVRKVTTKDSTELMDRMDVELLELREEVLS